MLDPKPVQEIQQSLPVYMMIGIIIIVGVSQIHRILGGILGVVFWLGIAVVGMAAYDGGHGIGLRILDLRFPRWLFLAMCLLFVGINVFVIYTAHEQKKRQTLRRALLRDDAETD